MRAFAELLDAQGENIAGIYAARAGGEASEWRQRMHGESDGTWYSAAESIEVGLATGMVPTRTDEGTPSEGSAPTARADVERVKAARSTLRRIGASNDLR